MFFVDDNYYTLDDIEKQFAVFEGIPYIKECENRRIAVCMSDAFQWLALCFYVQRKGGSVVPIHSSTPREGAIRLATLTHSHILLFQSLHMPLHISTTENKREGFLIQMSSGTTGTPKVIERSWESIEEELTSYVEALPIDAETTSIVACPVTHSYGLISGFLACLKRGAEPIIITNMNPKYILKKLEQYPNHIVYAAPVLLHTLACFLPSSQMFHSVMTSGTVMPTNWLELLNKKSSRVLQQYGCSEAGCVAIHPGVQDAKEMGYSLSHVKVEAGSIDMPAEIVIHTAMNTISTKDLGYIENGVVSFLSRMDDMINVAGLNVYPAEVENTLMTEPRIVEAVVYKKENPLSGERVCVQYVATGHIDEGEIREWCRERLAPHQIPVEIIRVDEIEKLPNGKISRKKLGGFIS
ncbi:AMP-binding protein [Priestia taiwanensis]|uniref:Acyl-CoA synthetase n=1 Tax=Priestia taiwanensis TaxID=1347902 RepID=A0A917EU50_9BACI|nr:AMP-binding protein [Priestia taiwanensis]MBM7364879.1 fatty-acyl-CoA synthase [Priestia taiwanensis]GGE82957.1 acyl-CoA synthetase [Priestia taiwanensis]